MAEERKHLMRPTAADRDVATGIANQRDRTVKPRPLSVRRDVFSRDIDSVDSLVTSVDTIAAGEDPFDVFELPIDTDVKGDVLTKTSAMSETNNSASGNNRFPVIKRKVSPESDSAEDQTMNTQGSFMGLPTKNANFESSNVETTSDAFPESAKSDSMAWPSNPNLSKSALHSESELDQDRNHQHQTHKEIPASREDSLRDRTKFEVKPEKPDRDDELKSGKPGFGGRTFNNNAWGRKSKDTSADSDFQLSSKSRGSSRYRPDRSAKAGVQTATNQKVFGTRTEARRERKERGLAAAATSLLTPVDEGAPGTSRSLLIDLTSTYSTVSVDDLRRRDEIYRQIPAQLPKFWSSKLVDCNLDDGRQHRVMFLWNDKGSELYIFDTATKAISGPELRSTYRNWELDPTEFARFVSNNRRYPDNKTNSSKSWPFNRSKRT